MGVSASCKHPEAAGKFLDYVFSKNVSEYYADQAGAYSCIKSVDVADNYAKVFTDSIRSGEFFLEEFAYESEKSNARDVLFQNLTSSPQTYIERTFLKEWNDLFNFCRKEPECEANFKITCMVAAFIGLACCFLLSLIVICASFFH